MIRITTGTDTTGITHVDEGVGFSIGAVPCLDPSGSPAGTAAIAAQLNPGQPGGVPVTDYAFGSLGPAGGMQVFLSVTGNGVDSNFVPSASPSGNWPLVCRYDLATLVGNLPEVGGIVSPWMFLSPDGNFTCVFVPQIAPNGWMIYDTITGNGWGKYSTDAGCPTPNNTYDLPTFVSITGTVTTTLVILPPGSSNNSLPTVSNLQTAAEAAIRTAMTTGL